MSRDNRQRRQRRRDRAVAEEDRINADSRPVPTRIVTAEDAEDLGPAPTGGGFFSGLARQARLQELSRRPTSIRLVPDTGSADGD